MVSCSLVVDAAVCVDSEIVVWISVLSEELMASPTPAHTFVFVGTQMDRWGKRIVLQSLHGWDCLGVHMVVAEGARRSLD